MKQLLIKSDTVAFRPGYFLNPTTGLIEHTEEPQPFDFQGLTPAITAKGLIQRLKPSMENRLRQLNFAISVLSVYWFVEIVLSDLGRISYKALGYVASEYDSVNDFWKIAFRL